MCATTSQNDAAPKLCPMKAVAVLVQLPVKTTLRQNSHGRAAAAGKVQLPVKTTLRQNRYYDGLYLSNVQLPVKTTLRQN